MERKKFNNQVEMYFREKEEKIKRSETENIMYSQFYGANEVISFLHRYNLITADKRFEYERIIDRAFTEYYKKTRS